MQSTLHELYSRIPAVLAAFQHFSQTHRKQKYIITTLHSPLHPSQQLQLCALLLCALHSSTSAKLQKTQLHQHHNPLTPALPTTPAPCTAAEHVATRLPAGSTPHMPLHSALAADFAAVCGAADHSSVRAPLPNPQHAAMLPSLRFSQHC